MDNSDRHAEDVRDLLEQGCVVPIVGAGVSKATAGVPGWKEILSLGLDHVTRVGSCPPGEIAEARELLNDSLESSLIQAAQRMTDLLKGAGEGQGEFPHWLRNQFHLQPADVKEARLIERILNLGCPILATTNFDKLLSMLSSPPLEPVTWQEPTGLHLALQDGGRVLHLHGVWDKPSSIILGVSDYERVVKLAPAYRDVLKILWLQYRLLFIGCSFNGLQDPDFMALLEWAAATFPDQAPKHYALMRTGTFTHADVARFLHTWRIQIVGFGEHHEDLPRWLEDVSPQRAEINPSRRFPGLPMPLTLFVGRKSEVKAILELVREEQVRLITLVGPGGVGKTRLAQEVARILPSRFPNGVYSVDLASETDPELVAPAIAAALGIRADRKPLLDALATFLESKRLLLVLDNFEHLRPAAPIVSELLARSPWLKVLITSRAPLGLRGERQFPVAPLDLPDLLHTYSIDQVTQFDAVRLFTDRARDAIPNFALTEVTARSVSEICVRLDGLPLAIELAAARMKIFSPPALLAHLEPRLPLLTGEARGTPARQQTMQSTIAWSYDLLAPNEQVLFRHMAVFVDGFTLAAVDAVMTVELGSGIETLAGITSLVDNSLVRPGEGPDGMPRFSMLETTREFALDRLRESGEEPLVRQRHALFYTAVADNGTRGIGDITSSEWLDRIELEYADIRSALAWTVEQRRITLLLQLAQCLGPYWDIRDALGDGLEWLRRTVKLSREATSGTVPRWVFYWAGLSALQHGFPAETIALGEELHHRAKQQGDHLGVAIGLALQSQGINSRCGADLARRACHLQARNAAQQALEALDALRKPHDAESETRGVRAWILNRLGVTSQALGNVNQSIEYYEGALKIRRSLGAHRGMSSTLSNLGAVFTTSRQWEQAHATFGESLDLAGRQVDRWTVYLCLIGCAELALAQGALQRAAMLLGAADRLRNKHGFDLYVHWKVAYERVNREVGPSTEHHHCWQAGQEMSMDDAIKLARAKWIAGQQIP